MDREALMYVIVEQYRTCNRNEERYKTTVMTYTVALKRKWKAVQS